MTVSTGMVSGAQMTIEHIIPISRGGNSDESNLCLACAWCNSYKWAKTQARDSATGEEAPLFNPRHQLWHEHFRWHENGVYIIGLTAIGRATVDALKMIRRLGRCVLVLFGHTLA